MNQLIFITRAVFFYFDFNSIHRKIGFIKQILKRPADFQFLTQRRSETSFPNIFNQNFKEMDSLFKISKISQIVLTLLHMVSFENFVKSLPPSLSELKVKPIFCFPIKIRDNPTASIRYLIQKVKKFLSKLSTGV